MTVDEIIDKLIEQDEPQASDIDYGEMPSGGFRRATRLAGSSSLMGYILADYSELVQAFGEPNRIDMPGDKIDAEWLLEIGRDEDVVFVDIYNYKSGKNYKGPDGPDVEDIRLWHVGGGRLDLSKIKVFLARFGFRFYDDSRDIPGYGLEL